jgi:hypothetical protein
VGRRGRLAPAGSRQTLKPAADHRARQATEKRTAWPGASDRPQTGKSSLSIMIIEKDDGPLFRPSVTLPPSPAGPFPSIRFSASRRNASMLGRIISY